MEIFDNLSWLYGDSYSIWATVFSTIVIYIAVIVITRVNGLRTFAKMSSFDFAITIAIGSLIASTMLSDKQSVLQGIVGLVLLIALQFIIANIRKRSDTFEKAMTNTPILLMEGEEIFWHNLDKTNVTEADLFAKLREANVTDMCQVLAVVLETTGDISVLHADGPNASLDKSVLKFVARSK